MSVEIRVPSLGESVTEATVARWFKQIGDAVVADEPLVELETDKVTLEFNAPASGVLAEIKVEEGGDYNLAYGVDFNSRFPDGLTVNGYRASTRSPGKTSRNDATQVSVG